MLIPNMRFKIKTTLFIPIVGFMVMAASFMSVLIMPIDSASALGAEKCREKYDSKEVTTALSNKMKDDKCAISQGGPCGGTLSASKGYFTCPDTKKADAFCKKKYPDNASNRNACRAGYFKNIAGCESFSGGKKNACEVGQKEYERLQAKPDAEPDGGDLDNPIDGKGCGGVKTAIVKCDADNSGGIESNGVWALLILVLNILTAGIGLVAVGGIVYGAILYTTAEDKADQVKKATGIITNVVIGLVLYAFMYAGLNFIVPGGIFN